jgi:hypothetical protein
VDILDDITAQLADLASRAIELAQALDALPEELRDILHQRLVERMGPIMAERTVDPNLWVALAAAWGVFREMVNDV